MEEKETEEQLRTKSRINFYNLFDSSLIPLNNETNHQELEKEENEMDWAVEDILDDSL